MAVTKIGERAVNLENVTYAEDARELFWPSADAPKQYIPLVKVHFVGGSAVKLYGRDAAAARQVFGLGQGPAIQPAP